MGVCKSQTIQRSLVAGSINVGYWFGNIQKYLLTGVYTDQENALKRVHYTNICNDADKIWRYFKEIVQYIEDLCMRHQGTGISALVEYGAEKIGLVWTRCTIGVSRTHTMLIINSEKC